MRTNRVRKGFTLIEVLLVIAFLAFVAGLVIYGFQNFAQFQQFNQGVSDVGFKLGQARTDARSAVNDESHGVYVTPTTVTAFQGDTYSAIDPLNDVSTYSLITISHSFSDGSDEIVFNKLTGLPSATGTITVTGVQFSASTTFTVTETGVVQ